MSREIKASEVVVGDVIDTRRGNQGRVIEILSHPRPGIRRIRIDSTPTPIQFFDATPVDLIERSSEPEGSVAESGSEEHPSN